MSYEIIDKEKELTIEIAKTLPTWKLPFIIGKTYKQLNSYLMEINAKATGAPYVRYLNLDWESLVKHNNKRSFITNLTKKWDICIGFPVSEELTGVDKITPSFFPEGRYLKALHKGPYHKITDTYIKMITWSKDHKFNLLDEATEIYTNDPQNTRKKDLRTVVLIPVND